MVVHKDVLKTLGWGVLWITGAVWFWLNMVRNPLDDLRLMLYVKTAHGQIVGNNSGGYGCFGSNEATT